MNYFHKAVLSLGFANTMTVLAIIVCVLILLCVYFYLTRRFWRRKATEYAIQDKAWKIAIEQLAQTNKEWEEKFLVFEKRKNIEIESYINENAKLKEQLQTGASDEQHKKEIEELKSFRNESEKQYQKILADFLRVDDEKDKLTEQIKTIHIEYNNVISQSKLQYEGEIAHHKSDIQTLENKIKDYELVPKAGTTEKAHKLHDKINQQNQEIAKLKFELAEAKKKK